MANSKNSELTGVASAKVSVDILLFPLPSTANPKSLCTQSKFAA